METNTHFEARDTDEFKFNIIWCITGKLWLLYRFLKEQGWPTTFLGSSSPLTSDPAMVDWVYLMFLISLPSSFHLPAIAGGRIISHLKACNLKHISKLAMPYKVKYSWVSGIRVWQSLGHRRMCIVLPITCLCWYSTDESQIITINENATDCTIPFTWYVEKANV